MGLNQRFTILSFGCGKCLQIFLITEIKTAQIIHFIHFAFIYKNGADLYSAVKKYLTMLEISASHTSHVKEMKIYRNPRPKGCLTPGSQHTWLLNLHFNNSTLMCTHDFTQIRK
ncbi:hypothetical protein ILYODFUR_026892 [Ilyodon furcidens]|uniref:Uncharacterized protein n=1 Tax=Ilyodon furcidens TaxID=33524 RepID=A0ABV0TDW4_9TELE